MNCINCDCSEHLEMNGIDGDARMKGYYCEARVDVSVAGGCAMSCYISRPMTWHEVLHLPTWCPKNNKMIKSSGVNYPIVKVTSTIELNKSTETKPRNHEKNRLNGLDGV